MILSIVKIDCMERLSNLYTMLSYLSEYKITLIEYDKDRKILNIPDNVNYIFIEDNNEILHRTKYYNIFLNKLTDKVVILYDIDCITPVDQLDEAINLVDNDIADICYPYQSNGWCLLDKRFNEHWDKDTDNLYSISTNNPKGESCGGVVVVNREKYLSVGGENEMMVGWCADDKERVLRAFKMGLSIKRIDGYIYHQWHPKGITSSELNPYFKLSDEEFNKVKGMNREEIKEYINKWTSLW